MFKKLRKKANLKHVRHDYHLSREADDQAIYDLAVRENRDVITQDDGFKKQVKRGKSAVFIIPSYITNKERDSLLTNFISGKNPQNYKGKATKV